MNEQEESAIRKRLPQDIVREVQAALSTAFKNPICLVAGRRPSTHPGNFVFAFSGKDITWSQIPPLTSILLAPFGNCRKLLPTDGWAWAQIRGVLTTDFHNQLYQPDRLLHELKANNPSLASLAYCSPRDGSHYGWLRIATGPQSSLPITIPISSALLNKRARPFGFWNPPKNPSK